MKTLGFLTALILSGVCLCAANIRLKDETVTTTTPLSDDFFYLDGATTGTSKMPALGVVRTNGTYTDPNWLPSLSWSKLTGTPTTIAGYGISVLPAANITGVIPIANLATGTPNGSKFIRDDGTLAVPPGGSGATVQGAISLTDGATIAVDATVFYPGTIGSVTIAGNRTLSNPTGAIDGQALQFRIRQDATGSRTLTLGTNFRFTASVPALSLNTAPNTYTYFSVRYSSADGKFDVIGLVQ